MKLHIDLIKQKPDSDDCLRCAGEMVFRYWDDPKLAKSIWKLLKVYKKRGALYGAYFSDLGKVASRNGYKSLIYHYDFSWWDRNVIDAYKRSTKNLVKALESFAKRQKLFSQRLLLEKEAEFVRAGGEFKFLYPKLETIDGYLKKQIPVILAVKGQDFYKSIKEDYPHAILIIGKEGDNYLIRDSFKGMEKIKAEDLYYSWVTNQGWMIVMYK